MAVDVDRVLALHMRALTGVAGTAKVGVLIDGALGLAGRDLRDVRLARAGVVSSEVVA